MGRYRYTMQGKRKGMLKHVLKLVETEPEQCLICGTLADVEWWAERVPASVTIMWPQETDRSKWHTMCGRKDTGNGSA